MILYPLEGGRRGVALLRWSVASLCVAAAHAGAGWWIVTHPVASATPPETVQGIPIDLEPVPVPENDPTPSASSAGGTAPAPQAAAAPTEPQPDSTLAPAISELQPPSPEPPPPDPAPPLVDPLPAPTDPSVVTPPEPPPVVLPEKETKSDAVVAPPPPPKPTPPEPDPRSMAREVARRKALAEKQAEQRAARAQARTEAKAAAQAHAAELRDAGGAGPAQAAPSGKSSGAAIATWRGAVQVHLRGFTPAGNGASGTARVAFAVDRGGGVVAASLAGSSGDSALDAAAVSIVRRASPVPAPPPELGGRISLVVPVHFQ